MTMMYVRCEVDSNAGVAVVSAVHVGGTRGSGIVSSAANVLWMDERGTWDERSWWSM